MAMDTADLEDRRGWDPWDLGWERVARQEGLVEGLEDLEGREEDLGALGVLVDQEAQEGGEKIEAEKKTVFCQRKSHKASLSGLEF